jgi:hypothetical protein
MHDRRASSMFQVALLASVLTLAAASDAPAAPRAFYGVGPQGGLTSADLDRMGQGRIGTLRIALNWFVIDPGPAPGDYDWSSVDPIVAGAARNGIDVLPFLYGTPDWVAQGLDGQPCSECWTFAPRSDAALAAWQTFVTDAVARYGPGGQFWIENPGLPARPIGAWQVWNEQNSPTFYQPGPSPKAYAKLLDASANAIRSRDPGADVILGGMAGLTGFRPAITAWAYLGKLYKRKGVKRDFDGVAPHPYAARLKKIKMQIDRTRAKMKGARDSKVSLWITEIGWGSAAGGNPLNRGPKGQAKRLTEAYKFFQKRRRKLKIRTVVWFSWTDSAIAICEWCPSSGLFDAALQPKPAWDALMRFTRGS